jgi:cellulose synthase/poly-beta-1,6-N-acetylglucosamine synthase-like glycosyltransferase
MLASYKREKPCIWNPSLTLQASSRVNVLLQVQEGEPDRVDVTVVIPCLNETLSIGFCIDKAFAAFRAAGLSGEVVVADNGSTDGSIQTAEQHGARVVRVAIRGYGSALRSGIEAARGTLIVIGR